MKSKTLLTMCPLLVLMAFKSVPCKAQFEIAPDHFEMPATQASSQAGNIAGANQPAGAFLGKFTLVHKVHYAGRTLMPGPYSFSLRTRGGWDVLTLTQKGTTTSIQARVRSRNDAGRPTALVLECAGEQRTLAGIRVQKSALQKSAVVLPIRPRQGGAIAMDSELVPISEVTSKKAGD